MKQYLRLGLFILYLLISLAGPCAAVDSASSMVYLLGGKSTITNGSKASLIITVLDLILYLFWSAGEKRSLIPVE